MKIRSLLVAVLALAAAVSVPAATPADAAFDALMRDYLSVHAQLIKDHFDDSSRKTASALSGDCKSLMSAQGLDPAARPLVQAMFARSSELAKADLKAARGIFGKLGDAIEPYLKDHYTGAGKYYRFFCDMVRKPWVQQSDAAVQNPFFDASMRSCGRQLH